jgi:hypothetical protein
MGSAPKFTVALATCAVLFGATVTAEGQERRAAPVYGEMPDQRPAAVVEGRRSATAPASRETTPAASPAPRPSEPGPSPVAIAVVAETPAAMPPGLSGDAPDTAPSIGVVGGGKAHGRSRGGSPAATPEPSTLLLMGAGFAALYRLRRRR